MFHVPTGTWELFFGSCARDSRRSKVFVLCGGSGLAICRYHPPPPPLLLSVGSLQMILASTDPAVDAGWVDSVGLTVLHRVAEALDLPYLALLLEERQKSQGRRCVDLSARMSSWRVRRTAAGVAPPGSDRNVVGNLFMDHSTTAFETIVVGGDLFWLAWHVTAVFATLKLSQVVYLQVQSFEHEDFQDRRCVYFFPNLPSSCLSQLQTTPVRGDTKDTPCDACLYLRSAREVLREQ